MKVDIFKALKVGVAIAGAGIGLAEKYFSDKDMDKKIDEAVAKALSEKRS